MKNILSGRYHCLGIVKAANFGSLVNMVDQRLGEDFQEGDVAFVTAPDFLGGDLVVVKNKGVINIKEHPVCEEIALKVGYKNPYGFTDLWD